MRVITRIAAINKYGTHAIIKDILDSLIGETSLVASHSLFHSEESPKSHVCLGTRKPVFAARTVAAMENKDAISEANS